MGAPFRKYNRGDPLSVPASTLNALIDSTRRERGERRSVSVRARRELRDQSLVVVVRNDSGADRARFDVLALSDILFGPGDNLPEFKNRPAFKGVAPGDESQTGYGILTEPIPQGELGEAVISGVSVARLDVRDVGDGFASVDPSDLTRLASGGGGTAEILWKQPGTGAQWGVVRIPVAGGGAQRVHFKIDNYDDYTGIADCTVTYRPCGASKVKEEDEYGKIKVRDPAGCYFNEDPYALIGRWGHADWMRPTEAEEPYPSLRPCRWIVSGLCCPTG